MTFSFKRSQFALISLSFQHLTSILYKVAVFLFVRNIFLTIVMITQVLFKLLPPGGKQPTQSTTFVSQLTISLFNLLTPGEIIRGATQLEQGGTRLKYHTQGLIA